MARMRGLSDHIRPGVLVLFVGINPGLRSAQTGHHFAGYSNRFWKLLYESKLVSEPLTYRDDARLPDWNLGLTNLIRRSSAGIDVLRPREYVRGRRRLQVTVRRYRPGVMALLGVTIYRMLFHEGGSRPVRLGWQRERFMGARVYLLPNPSGRNAHYPYRRMLTAFEVLHDAITRIRAKKSISIP